MQEPDGHAPRAGNRCCQIERPARPPGVTAPGGLLLSAATGIVRSYQRQADTDQWPVTFRGV
jgi:hypothetical protein